MGLEASMNLFGRSKAAFSGRLGEAMVALLLASSVSLYAQRDNDKERKSTAPTHQPSHQTSGPPSRQTHQAASPHTPGSGPANHGNPAPNGTNQPGSGRQFGNGRPSQPSTQTVTPGGGQPSGRQFGGGSGSNSGQPSNGTYNSGRFGSNNGRPGA